jgi:hypothetical protein
MTDSPFANVPVEEDTRIRASRETTFGDWPVLHQIWTWDGTRAESLIFLADDVAHLDDEALERMVGASPMVKPGSSLTVARERDGYTFVNFNFDY